MQRDLHYKAMRALIVQEVNRLLKTTTQEVENLRGGICVEKKFDDAIERINYHVELINGAMAVINARHALTPKGVTSE